MRAFSTFLRRTTNVECSHCKLRTRLTNRLRGHNTNRFTNIHIGSACKITTVTFRTNTVILTFTGQNRAYKNIINTSRFNSNSCSIIIDRETGGMVAGAR